MNQNVNIAEIISKLNEIDELIKSLHQKNISEIDKDILLEKIRKIYETTLIPKNNIVSEIKTKPIEKIEKKEIITETIKPVIENKEPIIEFTEIQTSEKKSTDESPTLFEVEKVSPPIKKEEDFTLPKKEKTEPIKQPSANKTISEQYQQNIPKTISDLMSKNQNDTNRLQLKPIKSLKSAISINDRIMFTNELFDSDADFYNEIIEKLNNMNNLSEALEHLKLEIDMNEESEAVQKFIELVHRRFL